MKEKEDSRYIYRNKLDKACFQHDMAYGYFKDLARRTASVGVLRDEVFKNPKYDGYQRASMVYEFFDENSKDSGVNNEIKQNVQLAEKLRKPIIKKIYKRRFYSSLKVNSKYAWIDPLKDKKSITIVNAFQKILDNSTKLQSMRKPNKPWVDKGSEFCNDSFKNG